MWISQGQGSKISRHGAKVDSPNNIGGKYRLFQVKFRKKMIKISFIQPEVAVWRNATRHSRQFGQDFVYVGQKQPTDCQFQLTTIRGRSSETVVILNPRAGGEGTEVKIRLIMYINIYLYCYV